MQYVTAYYPEYFDKSEWDRDFSLIREAGFSAVRFGEFAWSQMEPEEGVFDFAAIDAWIDAADRHGLKVILCTPTACPPIWLCEKHPDILPVDIRGRRTRFGARQHRCYNSPAYLEASRRIVTALAERYGADPRIAAWQIDNELCGEQKKCYCDHCRAAFQEYLKDRYGSIEDLNRRWGGHFWSEDYQRFDQIETPKLFAMDLCIWENPSFGLEYIRFSSDSIVRFCDMQAEILHRYTKVPVTTNTDDFYFGDTLDLYKLFKNLDVASFDCYHEQEYIFAFYCDFLRGVRGDGKFWVMENGDGSKLLGDMMDIAEERGCTQYSVFKFRPFPWGQEQSRTSLIDLYGRPMPNYETVRRHAARTEPLPQLAPRVGLLYDFDSSWAHNAKSLMLDCRDGLWYPNYLLHTVYRAVYEQGESAEVLRPDCAAPDSLPVVLAPRCILHDEALERELLRYVENGGTLVIDTDFMVKNKDNVFRDTGGEFYGKVYAAFGGLPFLSAEDAPRTVGFGKGKVVMADRELSLDGWKALLSELLD